MQQSSHEMEQSCSAIYSVMQSLIDSQQALVEVGEKLEDQNLKQFLLTESLKRAEFRAELESILNREGVGNLLESGTEPGHVQRALADLRLRSHEAGFHALISAAEESEFAACEAYTRAINAFPPTPILRLLASQASHIQQTHEFVKAASRRAA